MTSERQYTIHRRHISMFNAVIDLKDISSRLQDKHFNIRFAIDLFIDCLKKYHLQEIESVDVTIVWNSIDIRVEPIDGINKYDLAQKIKISLDESLNSIFDLNKVGWRINRYYDCTFTLW